MIADILTLDIGGTAVKYGTFQNGTMTEIGQFPVVDSDGIEQIPARLAQFVKGHPADTVAIALPGPSNYTTGTSLMEHKLPSMKNISLRDVLLEVMPDAKLLFVHDSTAFCYGALEENPSLKDKAMGCVMLGTGLGYTYVKDEKVYVNSMETPARPLWKSPYLDGIAEDYVSTRAMLTLAEQAGKPWKTILSIAQAANDGDEVALGIFHKTGYHLGKILAEAQTYQPFEALVIGGQISLSWSLFESGFREVISIPCSLVKDPATCALYGLYACARKGKSALYRLCPDAE